MVNDGFSKFIFTFFNKKNALVSNTRAFLFFLVKLATYLVKNGSLVATSMTRSFKP